jgi:hypothetical protein
VILTAFVAGFLAFPLVCAGVVILVYRYDARMIRQRLEEMEEDA